MIPLLDKTKVQELSNMLKALAYPARINILSLLCHGGNKEKTVIEIYKELKITQPVVSRHLGILRNCGIVTRSTEGKLTYYEPTAGSGNASKIIRCLIPSSI